MSYVGEVVADNSGKFCGNSLRFATEEEATVYVSDLARRWTLVREQRVVQSFDPVTHVIKDGVMDVVPLDPPDESIQSRLDPDPEQGS